MAVLVTGGGGYIGSHMVWALPDAGEQVVVIDRLSTGFRWAIAPEARFYEGDIADTALMRQIFSENQLDSIIHFAGSIVVPESVADPLKYYRNNTTNTRTLLECCLAAGVRHFVFSSTAAVYGNPGTLPTPEAEPIAPLSPYGTSKAAAEWYLGQYRRLHGISTLALRMANVYGPRQDPQGEAGVVSIFCGIAAAGGRATVFGDGTQTRDYVFVEDVVDA